MHPETQAIHVGNAPDAATGAVVPPIHMSTTFVREPDGSYASGYSYGRSANPNRTALEECLVADGCEIEVVSGAVLVIEWQRGQDAWRETYLSAHSPM